MPIEEEIGMSISSLAITQGDEIPVPVHETTFGTRCFDRTKGNLNPVHRSRLNLTIKTFGQPKKAAATTPTPPITTPKTPPKIPRIYGFNLNDLDPARRQYILTYATVGAVK
ncbi:hypothetical protein E4U38_008498, partial [Claviceps purpurea]